MTVNRRVVRAGLLMLLAVTGWLSLPQSFGGRIAYIRVDGHSMDPTYSDGDLAVVRSQRSYAIGDPVTYRIPKGEFGAGARVIHRIIGGDGIHGFVTKGDNRTIADPWHPHTSDVVGRVVTHVSGAGDRIATLGTPVNLGGLMAGLTVTMMLLPDRKKRQPASVPDPQETADA